MASFQAGCHCGNVTILMRELPESLMRCNCSICRRTQALWGHFHPDQVTVTCHKEETQGYIWGDRQISFHHCPLCGSTTHYAGLDALAAKRVSVNFRLCDPTLIRSLKILYFDGADSWQIIEPKNKEYF